MRKPISVVILMLTFLCSTSGIASAAYSLSDFIPGSNVDEHEDIGLDIAKISALLVQRPIDFAAVKAVITGGGESRKSDGTNRTIEKLATTVPGVVTLVLDAANKTGASAESSDAIRAQRIDKGISAILRAKVLEELDAAGTKLAEDNLSQASGAPHNVDEAWAFFIARGHGLALAAERRASDFKLSGEVSEPVIVALQEAQTAAVRGKGNAFNRARAEVAEALNYIFYLATFKYLDTCGDPVRRAEGETFYLAIQPLVRARSAESDAAISVALSSDTGNPVEGREALNSSRVLQALGIRYSKKVEASQISSPCSTVPSPGGQRLGTVPANSIGRISGSVVVPPETSQGTYEIRATGIGSPPAGTLVATPSTVAPGGSVTITASDYAGNATVTLSLVRISDAVSASQSTFRIAQVVRTTAARIVVRAEVQPAQAPVRESLPLAAVVQQVAAPALPYSVPRRGSPLANTGSRQQLLAVAGGLVLALSGGLLRVRSRENPS